MKKLIFSIVIILHCLNITSAVAQTAKTCTIQLRYDTISANYYLQPATKEDSAVIYIRRGDAIDSQTYLYTNCDTIFVADSSKVKLPNGKYHTINGFQDNNDVEVGNLENGKPKKDTQNTHNLQNNRTDYIAFKNKPAGVSGLSIKKTNQLLISLMLRPMRLDIDSIPADLTNIELRISRQKGKERIDTTLSAKLCKEPIHKENTYLFHTDTICLYPMDSIQAIHIERSKTGLIVWTDMDTTQYDVKIQHLSDKIAIHQDDIVFTTKTTLSPKIGTSPVTPIIISGYALTKNKGVIPIQVEIIVKEEQQPVTFYWVLWAYIIIGIIIIGLIVWTITKTICRNKKSKEKHKVDESKNIDDKDTKNDGQYVSTKPESKDNEIIKLKNEITELKTQQTNIIQEKQKVEKELTEEKQKFKSQKLAAETDKQKALTDLENSHKSQIQEKEKKIGKLETEKEELAAKVNIGRDELLKQFKGRLDDVKAALKDLVVALITVPNEEDIYSSTLQNLLNDFDSMYSTIYNNDWNDKDLYLVRTELQQILKRHLAQSGWINIIGILTGYSRVAIINSELEKHGIQTYAMENLAALICSLLGIVNMSIIVPTVLLSEFDSKYYESINEEIWIDKYCPTLSIYDYKGVIIDIIRVGYTLAESEHQKPLVCYN